MAEKIKVEQGKLIVPSEPIIPFIEGDGIGPDIWHATRLAVDAAINKAYGGKRRICWKEVEAGERSFNKTGEWLPQATIDTIKEYIVAIKGPLTTPVGEGFRSLNVSLRQELDLFACVRPVKWISGVPSPLVNPDWVDVIIFRENSEDIYVGIEWPDRSEQVGKVRKFLNGEMSCYIPDDAGIGIKYMGRKATERIMRRAMVYALENKRKVVTIVHKGNIMKYTEGAFRNWCYDLAEKEFGEFIIFEKELTKMGSQVPEGKVVVNDRIADNMFQQLILKCKDYDVLVCPNLNGDYISDAAAALVGGLGMAPGANFSDYTAVFEATHGTAPKYAGLDVVNPGSLLLSAVMMLDYLGWKQAGALLEKSLNETIIQKVVTYDLARSIEGAQEVTTSKFVAAMIENM